MSLNGTPLNKSTLGQTITDPINQMIIITKYISYTKYAFERHLGLVQPGLAKHTSASFLSLILDGVITGISTREIGI